MWSERVVLLEPIYEVDAKGTVQVNRTSLGFSFRHAAAAAAMLAICAIGAQADPYPGSALSLTNGGGVNAKDLFTFSADGKTVTLGEDSGGAFWKIGGTELVGIRSIFLVTKTGALATGISTATNGGFVKLSKTAMSVDAVWKDLDKAQKTSAIGYDDGDNGKGFADGSHWLVLADPTLAGKASTNKDTFGSFTFSQSLLDAPGALNYDIGFDYILKGGVTARGYIANYSPIVHTNAVPEASTFVGFGSLLMAGGTGIWLRRRKK